MIIPPVPTPFDAQGRPDWTAFAELVQAMEPHVDALLLYGSNGEAVHLTPDERRQGLAAVAPKKPFWVGAGDESLPQTRALIGFAAEAGARAVLVTPPRYYAASLAPANLVDHFRSLAADNPVPIWLYHVPQLTKADLPLDVIATLAGLGAVQGIKDSSGDLSRIAWYAAARLRLTVYTGHATTLLGGLALGSTGAILAAAALAPKPYRALLDAWNRGDLAEARRLQNHLEPLGRLIGQGGFVLLKQAMRHLGLPAGFPRSPYPHESPLWKQVKPLLDELKEANELIV